MAESQNKLQFDGLTIDDLIKANREPSIHILRMSVGNETQTQYTLLVPPENLPTEGVRGFFMVDAVTGEPMIEYTDTKDKLLGQAMPYPLNAPGAFSEVFAVVEDRTRDFPYITVTTIDTEC